MTEQCTQYLPDEAATLAAGKQLANAVQAGATLFLLGDLGAGKTTLVRGFLAELGHIGKVKSPTYTIVEPYVISNKNIYHFDLYRFIDENEWEAAGFRDYFDGQAIALIEWPQKAEHLLPPADLTIMLTQQSTGRQLQLQAHTSLGQACLKSFSSS